MTIEVSPSINGIVWLIRDNKIKKCRITKIEIHILPIISAKKNASYNEIRWYVDDDSTKTYKREELFPSKEALLQSL